MAEVTRIRVSTEAPYDVIVGRGVHGELPGVLGDQVRRVAIIASSARQSTAAEIVDIVASNGYEPRLIEVPDAEQAKTSTIAAFCWAELGQAGFTRSDAVVSVGGGATTDLAGFVAATFLRGIRVVHVPTTVLAMVDAAVGGKTGINTAEGKNLVGAIHEPAGVLCDLSHLETLPPADLASGLAEVVKCGFIADESILTTVESDPEAALDPTSSAHRALIEAAIRVKAAVVALDLRESTSQGRRVGREALNYGHTFAHALERAERYAVRHGDAVSVGLVYVAELARLAGMLDRATAARHGDVLRLLGLPTRYTGASWDQLHSAMRVDKKSRGDTLRFVVIERIGRPAILAGPDPGLLTAAYAEVAR